MSYPRCRLCSAELRHTFVDLGMSPPCESYLTASQLDAGETFYPLHVRVCENCLLVQLPAYISPEDVFSDYAYFSSYSDSWVAHARRFVDTAATRLGLGTDSFVVEVASNDGYLLQHSVARGIRSLGIEPAANIAEVARDKGIDTEVMFLGEQTGRDVAARHGHADLVVANNVFAHVPDIVDFSKGLRALVADSGRVSIEIPHLLRLIEGNEYDTIYHEHYSYLTLLTATACACSCGSEWSTSRNCPPTAARCGSGRRRLPLASKSHLPWHACWRRRPPLASTPSRATTGSPRQVATARNDFVEFLIGCQRSGKRVAGYGAPGKGNTLLNHCGIRSDLMEFTVDRNPHKHGLFLPGTHIPIHPVERLAEERPDYVVIMPWNLREEITAAAELRRGLGRPVRRQPAAARGLRSRQEQQCTCR